MALPAPNLYPDFNIIRLSHIELVVRDLAVSKAFYADTLGLQVTFEDATHIYLRAMEERGHHCVILKKGDEPCVNVCGFKVYDEEDLDRAETFFKAKGLPTEWITRPHQGRTLLTRDNMGMPIEFYHKMDRLDSIHQKYKLYNGVKPLRIDHFNYFSPDVDASIAFWNDMGFRVTEHTSDAETGRNWAAWMHRKGGVHDTNIERGPGRHGISNAFFLYILCPDGHRTEIYCSDYQTVDPDHEPINWDLKDPQRQTLWGAAAPRSWFEHGSTFEGVPTSESDLKAQPIIAP
jgi:catechol 2,3-dioxygenase